MWSAPVGRFFPVAREAACWESARTADRLGPPIRAEEAFPAERAEQAVQEAPYGTQEAREALPGTVRAEAAAA